MSERTLYVTMIPIGSATQWRDIKEPFIIQDNSWWPNRIRLSVAEAESLVELLQEQLARPDLRRPFKATQ